ncbi:MAG TPA: DUF2911 domain-containing protein [Holophagaceae bacterium]|jgi:hypothetical protein|nr:DUF2911 domain-containing protein [Holophagaceae bacterium]
MRDRAIPVLLLAAAALPAQVRQIRESPAASVSQELGLTKVEINYHRPAVKGRVIWGGLVPYGQVWRAGANEATTISFTGPVKVAGHDVPSGTYALFAIPGKDRWTLILDKNAKQWGAFSYKPDQDLLRFDVTPSAAPMQEWLDYIVELADQATATVTLHWEKLAVSFPVTVEIPGLAALRTEWSK